MKIVAVGLRYYKCYEATEVVPLFFGSEKFIGFIGENGVGKSAVLEALRSFFTGQHWIRNKTGKKGESTCLVAPIVCLSEKELPLKEFTPDEISEIKKNSKVILKNIKDKISNRDSRSNIYISAALFQNGDTKIFDGGTQASGQIELARKIKDFIVSYFRYIYIEAEVDIDTTTDINSKTLEFIKGSGVVGEISKILEKVRINDETGQDKKISDVINNKVLNYLNTEVIEKLRNVDNNYDYKNLKTGAISKISEKQISELATQALFNNRELTKKIKGKHIGISDMSSGQRRRALLDFILVMISNLDESNRERVILAIDEPELSVDASSRIQQFEKLYKTVDCGPSIVFTTHWYGWIAQLIYADAILIRELDKGREIVSSSVENFLEQDTQKKVPYEMRMMFDFLSSLGSWSELDSDKKFVICEGITDFNYIVKHFSDYKIIPVRGREDVVRLYKIFTEYYFRVDKKPKNVIFLIDTDPEKAVDLKDIKGNNLKRISRDNSGNVKIVSNNSDNYSEKCAIEDVLSPKPFLSALKGATEILENQTDKDFINNLNVVYEDQTGIRAFSLDDVIKIKFKEIYKSDFKKRVSELYSPSSDDIKNFQNIFKIF